MDKNYESYYRLFESSWGILIGYSGKIIEANSSSTSDDLIKINSSIFLQLDIPSENKYIKDNLQMIVNGIKWVSSFFTNKSPLIIVINKIDLNFCNFQIEGLFFGIANWICNYLNKPLPTFYYKYDNINNKYLFWFDVDDIKSRQLLYPDVPDSADL